MEARREALKRCVTSKRMLTNWFLDWYWQAFEGDISSALGRGLHSFTSQLNLSASYGIGGARRGCIARVKRVLGGV